MLFGNAPSLVPNVDSSGPNVPTSIHVFLAYLGHNSSILIFIALPRKAKKAASFVRSDQHTAAAFELDGLHGGFPLRSTRKTPAALGRC